MDRDEKIGGKIRVGAVTVAIRSKSTH